MMNRGEQEMVADYVFCDKDDKKVELALKVLGSRDEIQRRIIEEFVDKLRGCLKEKLGTSWLIEDTITGDVHGHWRWIGATKKEWDGLYRISLEPGYNKARSCMGVWCNYREIKHGVDNGKIREAVEAQETGEVRYPTSGKPTEDWPFWFWAECYSNWDDEKVLFDLHKDCGEKALDYFGNTLIGIARDAEKVIGGIVPSHPKSP